MGPIFLQRICRNSDRFILRSKYLCGWLVLYGSRLKLSKTLSQTKAVSLLLTLDRSRLKLSKTLSQTQRLASIGARQIAFYIKTKDNYYIIFSACNFIGQS
ncbi:hypothetical protein B1J93_01010 [Leptospira kirschneri serovar Pomona]|uniref:Uncharacterized protein n=1 Tax=Leptospira kirschneri serovar Pomona TaxID=561005 RepID=A0A1T1E391_9LEPT|nr:hypothetical protein B1J93_01010 [Leptospira kirschneri serovar Pomona]